MGGTRGGEEGEDLGFKTTYPPHSGTGWEDVDGETNT